MDGIGRIQGGAGVEAEASFNTRDHFFAGRKIAINHDSLMAICTSDTYPFDDQVDTLYEVVSQCQFSPEPGSCCQRMFSVWFLGEVCQLSILNYPCLCHKVHKAYPNHKVGGVLFENQLLFDQSDHKNVSALLSLAACNLIEADRFLALHNRQNNVGSQLLARAGVKRRESDEQLNKAYELDPVLTQNQIRSWLIQYAFNRGEVFHVEDIEQK